MTQNEKRYNGWTNYETWVTALWLDNVYETHCVWQAETRECRDAAPQAEQVAKGDWSVEEAARFILADRLKDAVEKDSPLQEGSLYSDLLGAALQDVNWSEIAYNWLADLGND